MGGGGGDGETKRTRKINRKVPLLPFYRFSRFFFRSFVNGRATDP